MIRCRSQEQRDPLDQVPLRPAGLLEHVAEHRHAHRQQFGDSGTQRPSTTLLASQPVNSSTPTIASTQISVAPGDAAEAGHTTGCAEHGIASAIR